MKRLTIRAEEDGVKAVWYGERDVFIEGEVGYAEADKLAHYEDLEEQGRLIELPCAVGDTVYDIAGKEIRKQIVDGVEYTKDGFFIYANEDEWIGMFGDLVFLTKEEAEAKLKEAGEQE